MHHIIRGHERQKHSSNVPELPNDEGTRAVGTSGAEVALQVQRPQRFTLHWFFHLSEGFYTSGVELLLELPVAVPGSLSDDPVTLTLAQCPPLSRGETGSVRNGGWRVKRGRSDVFPDSWL